MGLFVMLAHMASGSNWVMSTVLVQRRAPDQYRGRVFSLEWLLFKLAQSLSVTVAAVILEFGILFLRETMALFSGLLVLSGIFWLFKIAPAEEKEQRDQKMKNEAVST
jgi:predicted MFS family arabinose efflux permease